MKKLMDILLSICPECDFAESKDFIQDGLLDSFDIISLVIRLEKEFGISIDGDDVRSENFSNLETLEKFVRRYSDYHEP